MCEECHQSPCAHGCPNAPDPRVLGHCELRVCNSALLEGQEAYTDGFNYFCSLECATLYHGIRLTELRSEDFE